MIHGLFCLSLYQYVWRANCHCLNVDPACLASPTELTASAGSISCGFGSTSGWSSCLWRITAGTDQVEIFRQ